MKKLLKKLILPVTLLTVITLLSIIITIYFLYVAFTHAPESAIYAAVSIPITIVLGLLYTLDRYLVKKVAYYKLNMGELIIGLLIFLYFAYQDSYMTINFHTDQDYILVLFDSKENSISRFEKKGLFSKELNLFHSNIEHLDRSLGLRKDLRIIPPMEWQGVAYQEGYYTSKKDSIKYIYLFKEIRDTTWPKLNSIRASEVYIDSLLKREIKSN
ncbi:hypothetical protein [Flagellimonas beolgyonensis]|uniref:hypothetical protein n=1 Tax=Flagellimonas beolgyonensis TaxID=864064 RepID=UPI003D65CF10